MQIIRAFTTCAVKLTCVWLNYIIICTYCYVLSQIDNKLLFCCNCAKRNRVFYFITHFTKVLTLHFMKQLRIRLGLRLDACGITTAFLRLLNLQVTILNKQQCNVRKRQI